MIDKSQLPIQVSIFHEALGRAFDYTMNPKREAEIRYIARFAQAQERYIVHVQDCLTRGETPMTWAAFIERENGGDPVGFALPTSTEVVAPFKRMATRVLELNEGAADDRIWSVVDEEEITYGDLRRLVNHIVW